MNPLSTALGVYLNDLPYFLLCVSIMWDHMRISRRRAWAVMIGMATLHATSIFCWMTFYGNYRAIQLPHEIVFLCIFLAGLLYGVRLRPTRLLFAAFMVKFYADALTSTAKTLEIAFWPLQGQTSFSWHFNLLHLALLCLTLPPMWLFVMRKLRPIFLVESAMWRWFWLLPGLFYLAHLTFTLYETQNIYTVRYVLFSSLLFCLSLLVYSIITETLRATQEKARLEAGIVRLNQQLDLQRAQYSSLMESAEKDRIIRHDSRHHLAVLGDFCESGDLVGLRQYIGEIKESLPAPARIWCENLAANAIANHYIVIAESEGIRVDAAMDIPRDIGQIPDADLCVVLGNLLENAIEASRWLRPADGTGYIKLRARAEEQHLSLMVENSFDGILREHDGVYFSRKTQGNLAEGLGIPSVRAICEKHDGILRMEINGNVWRALALLTMVHSPVDA